MTITNESRSAMRELHKLLGPIPDAVFASMPIEKLALPVGLFDEKTPLSSNRPFETLLPLIVAKTDHDDRYSIIDGCKRFLTFAKNNGKECACGILSKAVDPKNMGLLRIALNQGRTMHLRERLCFFKWLSNNFSEALCETLFHEAGLGGFELKPLTRCADDIIDAVAEGRINVRNAGDFSLMGHEDRKAFLELFDGLFLSQQTEREFLEWLPEIAYSRNISVSALLKSEGIGSIMAGKTLNAPQKIEAARDLVHSWKFPLYSDALKTWKQAAAATSRAVVEGEQSSQVVFLPDPAFEKNKLEIRISIAHARAAKEIFERLSKIPLSTWARLIYPAID